MKAYRAILSARFRTLLQYRAAALAGLGTQVFWGLIRMMIFIAFYENTTAKAPMDLQQVIAYVWLGQAFLLLVPFRLDTELEMMIRTGSVTYELLRPVDLFNFWYSRAIATRVAPVAMRCVPIVMIASIAGWIRWPGIANAAAGVACLCGAVLLGSAISMIMTITMFWTISGRGIHNLIAWLGFFLSGNVLPLLLFPDWMQPLLNVLPFRGLIDLPFRMFIGNIPAGDVGYVLAHQLGWTAALIIFGRWLLGRAVQRLAVQGG